MNGIGLLGAVLVGMAAGAIAGLGVGRRQGLLTDLAFGLGGAAVGALIVRGLGVRLAPGVLPSLIVSSLGAVILRSGLTLLRRAPLTGRLHFARRERHSTPKGDPP
jgi:uncharacterized membrane protein YeaQ/YmgE (transglycosylase-associated protein family)